MPDHRFQDERFFAWLDVARTHAAVSRHLERALRPMGLTVAFCEVLVRLGQAGRPRLSMTELGERVFLTRSGVTQLVDRMQRAGLVERTPDPGHRSITRVALTPHGRVTLARVSPVFADAVHENFSRHLTNDQVGAVRAGLGAVTTALGEPPESAVDPVSGTGRQTLGATAKSTEGPPSTAPVDRPSGRRPGTGETRANIAAAARHLFAARGYDGVSMRAIAAEAGVDPALIHHFFGTKKELFDALVELPFDPDQVVAMLLAPGVEGLGERIARFVVTTLRGPETGEAMVAVFRTAAAQPEAARVLREIYARRLLEPVAAALDTDRPLLRAALCSSQLLGLLAAEHVVGLDPLVALGTEDLVAICGAILQRNLTEPLPGGP